MQTKTEKKAFKTLTWAQKVFPPLHKLRAKNKKENRTKSLQQSVPP